MTNFNDNMEHLCWTEVQTKFHEEQKTDVATKQSGLVAMLQSQQEENHKISF